MFHRWRNLGSRTRTPSAGRIVVSLAAGAALLTFASPAASATQPIGYVSSPGSAKCSFTATVRFNPPLTESHAARHVSIKATLSPHDCSSDWATLVAGRFSGALAQSPVSCAMLDTTHASVIGTARWTSGYHNGAGFVGYTPTEINGGTASGSFAGAATFTLNGLPAVASSCAAGGRIRSTRMSGTFATGPVCPPGQDPVTSGPVTLYTISGGSLCATIVPKYWPSSIAPGSDGALWFATTQGVGRITTSGAVSFYPAARAGSDAESITAGPDGALWFTSEHSIGRITTSGVVSTYALPSTDDPDSITAGPDGALWFTNTIVDSRNQYTGASIGRITTAGAITFFSSPVIDEPSSITAGPDGALWFTNAGSFNKERVHVDQSIGRISTSGVVTSFTGPGISSPTDITTGPDGALWFTNGAVEDQSIARITTSGVVSGYTFPTDSLTAVDAITTGPDGNLWFTYWGQESAIGSMTTSGVVTLYTDPQVLFPADPNAITVGSDGALWFVNRGNDSIGRIAPPG